MFTLAKYDSVSLLKATFFLFTFHNIYEVAGFSSVFFSLSRYSHLIYFFLNLNVFDVIQPKIWTTKKKKSRPHRYIYNYCLKVAVLRASNTPYTLFIAVVRPNRNLFAFPLFSFQFKWSCIISCTIFSTHLGSFFFFIYY